MDGWTRVTVTILLLVGSNVFMNFAWYGHLKFKDSPLWMAILASWIIASLEYCLQVPANRIGYKVFTATQLKIMQEVITIVVFLTIAVLYLDEKIRWNYIAGFGCILLAVFFVFGFPDPDRKTTDGHGDEAHAAGTEAAPAAPAGSVAAAPSPDAPRM